MSKNGSDSDLIIWSLSLIDAGRIGGWNFSTLRNHILRTDTARNILDTVNPDKMFCNKEVLVEVLGIIKLLED